MSDVAAVSYTHLDVYKRQVYRVIERGGYLAYAAADFLDHFPVIIRGSALISFCLCPPVSYTHLVPFTPYSFAALINRNPQPQPTSRRSIPFSRASFFNI